MNFKLGCIARLGSKCMVCVQPLLKLKTRPKARPCTNITTKLKLSLFTKVIKEPSEEVWVSDRQRVELKEKQEHLN